MIKKLRGFIYEDYVTAKEYAEKKEFHQHI